MLLCLINTQVSVLIFGGTENCFSEELKIICLGVVGPFGALVTRSVACCRAPQPCSSKLHFLSRRRMLCSFTRGWFLYLSQKARFTVQVQRYQWLFLRFFLPLLFEYNFTSQMGRIFTIRKLSKLVKALSVEKTFRRAFQFVCCCEGKPSNLFFFMSFPFNIQRQWS